MLTCVCVHVDMPLDACQHQTKACCTSHDMSTGPCECPVLTHAYGYQFYSSVGTLTVVFLGESPHHLHTLVRVAPPHIPHMQSIQRATLAVSLTRLRLGGRILSANPVQALRVYAWIHRSSEQCSRS